MQKRKEIMDRRLAKTQKLATSRSEILEIKRVLHTQRRAMELKENRIAAIDEMQKRQLQLRMEKLKLRESQNVSKANQLTHMRSHSQAEEAQLQEEMFKLTLARKKVVLTQVKELEESEQAMLSNVEKMQADEKRNLDRVVMKSQRSGENSTELVAKS